MNAGRTLLVCSKLLIFGRNRVISKARNSLEFFRLLQFDCLSEAVWLTHRADVRLIIDKQAACGEGLAINFQ